MTENEMKTSAKQFASCASLIRFMNLDCGGKDTQSEEEKTAASEGLWRQKCIVIEARDVRNCVDMLKNLKKLYCK